MMGEDIAANNFFAFLLCFQGYHINGIKVLNFWSDFLLQTFLANISKIDTIMILSFGTDRSGQTVQTQRSSLIRVYTVCSSLCIFWMHYSEEKLWMHYSEEKPSCSTFRVITANFLVSEILGILR